MSFPLPKIVYPSSVTNPNSQTTLQLKRQFRKVPAYSMQAVRHDNTASSGVREVLLERVNNFFEGELEYIAIGDDLSNWQAFMASALQGVPFDLYLDPVNQPTSFTTYFLDDTTWRPDWKFVGQYTFKVKFYQRVNWP
jgi:hypothetical protein